MKLKHLYALFPPNSVALCQRLTATGLIGALATGDWTVFAPINQAFVDLSRQFLDDLDDNLEVLGGVLLFHVIPNEVIYKKDLPCVARENLLMMANSKDSRTLCKDITPGVPEPRFQKGAGNPEDNIVSIAAVYFLFFMMILTNSFIVTSTLFYTNTSPT